MISVYVASKLHHAPMWRRLFCERHRAAGEPRFHFTSRWPYLVGQVEESPGAAKHFWIDDLADLTRADVVLAYAEETDLLAGALVEVGMALGQGKTVVLVGQSQQFSTWQFHPLVRRFASITNAMSWIAAEDARF